MSVPDLSPQQPTQTFEAPWQAQIFALVIKLHQDGHFAWGDFSQRLAKVIAMHERQGIERDYYQNWYDAALSLLAERGLVDQASLDETAKAIVAHQASDHGHVAHHGPIAIATAVVGEQA